VAHLQLGAAAKKPEARIFGSAHGKELAVLQ
jgi:hypothetical protein